MAAEIRWTGNFDRFARDKAEQIVDALRAQMGRATMGLLSYIKDEKLSGEVLHQRSGNLIRSGHSTTSETSTELQGAVTFGSGPSSGDNVVPYAAIQNYGGTIPAVDGKLMVFERDGATIFTRRHKAFQLPARNYLESSMEEQKDDIIAGFQAAFDEAASK